MCFTWVKRFISITERYWLHIDPRLEQSLLGRSGMIGWEKALPLLRFLGTKTKTSSKVKAIAQDYKGLILGASHKN